MEKIYVCQTPPQMVDKSDGLNNLTGNNCKRDNQNTGDRDDRNKCMDVQAGLEWDLYTKPLSVELDETMFKYIEQLMTMEIGDFPHVEDDTCGFNYIPIFRAQSGITEDTEIEQTSSTKVGTMTFRDQMEGYTNRIESFTDPTRMLQDKNEYNLANFYKRPVRIFQAQWGTGTTLATSFNPWALYLRDPYVANRITNYKLLRCNLRMKIVINGNGFLYGRALVAYQPLAGYDNLSSHAALVQQDLVQTSQLPHFFLDPTTSAGGEMNIPFFWHHNYFDLTVGDYGGLLSIPDAGRVYIRTLNPLKHANGAADAVTVTVFCWAEDMELSQPTGVNQFGLPAQSGEEINEANTKGMISGPATAISKFAGIAAGYAPIAPYAMATSKVAGSIASAAKIMGYSRPPVTVNPDPFRPVPISQLATTTTPDTALKMTVDDKQELTIDPRISGVGSHDPLVIRDIAKRESYLTTFTWGTAVNPTAILWNARVNPVLWSESPGGTIHLPACAVAAIPFRYWTGTIKFRFQIVCSNFHKGRLEFRYDPTTNRNTEANDFNLNTIEIIDIADTQDFTIEIGNAQPFSLLKHLVPGVNAVSEGYSLAPYAGSFNNQNNGVLGVKVLNELTVPNSTVNNDVQINVFISAGEDFEVFVPVDDFQKYTFFPAQSGVEIMPDSQNTQEPSAPQQAMSENLGGDLVYSSDLNKVFAGESIVSFRPLLKRYNLWRREQVSRDNLQDQVSIMRERAMYPFYRKGPVAAVIDSSFSPYNFANTVMLHWISTCFSGWRGSIRYKYLFTKSASCGGSGGSCCDDIGSRVYVERLDPRDTAIGSFAQLETNIQPPPQNPTEASRRAMLGSGLFVPTGARGTVFATDLINPCVEFEVPYQTQYRFVPGKPSNYTTAPNFFMNDYRITYEGHTTPEQEIDIHVAAGEDFQVYFWTGLPRVYYEPIPPLVEEPIPAGLVASEEQNPLLETVTETPAVAV